MSGYSVKIANTVSGGNTARLGIILGITCIEAEYPVSKVAERLGVSRQTVYNWYYGEYDPSPDRAKEILALIDELR